eukprot:TRINITY_DN8998_c0_g1_i1.p1 TRINITY_DN8998_c0_g1~~TRINITY_DN8998_c0_g1_i1.p1  ORF type:complete len:436 (-),score=33.40 TRINITY_DN8998_c0_g1_i1:249-1466(-)
MQTQVDEQIANPYEVLGVDVACSDEQIRQAYKKLALKYHPDKNDPGDKEAAKRFQEISAAYAIVGDPAKRQQFDAGGFDRIVSGENQHFEVDPQSMNTMERFVASMFSRVGVQVRTNVSLEVLESVYNNEISPVQLLPQGEFSGVVSKQQAHFFSIKIDQQTIDEGFCIVAHSTPQQSRFKLLLFDLSGEGGYTWSLAHQEDSVKLGKSTVCGLYFMGFDTYTLDSSIVLDSTEPEFHVFRTLDKFSPRQKYVISPGEYLVAVYGDNFIKKSSYYSIQFLSAIQIGEKGIQIKTIESQLVQQQKILPQLERDFRRIQQQYEEIVSKIKVEVEATEDLVTKRDETYRILHGLQDKVGKKRWGQRSDPINDEDLPSVAAETTKSGGRFSVRRLFPRKKPTSSGNVNL